MKIPKMNWKSGLVILIGIFLVAAALKVFGSIDILGAYHCTSSTANNNRCQYTDTLVLHVDDQWVFQGKTSTYTVVHDDSGNLTGTIEFQGDFPFNPAQFDTTSTAWPPTKLTFQRFDGEETWTRE